jgi:ElaB/YqjD/DUF883 family membrane-anchored ribosome-binding protein
MKALSPDKTNSYLDDKKNILDDTKSAYPELEAISDDFKALKSDVANLAAHVKKQGLKDVTNMAKAEYKSVLALGQKFEDRIKEKPAQSIAIAFAGGLILSLLLGRR